MNVDKLIEDAREKMWSESVIRDSDQAVEFGVRYALAAMFEVVKVEELKEGEHYFCVCDEKEYLGMYKVALVGVFQGMNLEDGGWRHMIASDCSGFRRCPTPGDVGIGGV